jgi:MFS family permease
VTNRPKFWDTWREEGSAANTWLSLLIPSFIFGLGGAIAAPALPVYARSFDVSFGTASLIIAAYLVGSMVATLPSGYLADRIGRRKVILAGGILTAVSSLLVVTATSFPELLVYRFLSGFGAQAWQQVRITVIADRGGAQRGRQITGMSAVQNAGRLFGPALGGLLAVISDIRAPFIVHAVLVILAVIPSYALIQESVPERAQPARGDGRPATVADGSLRAWVLQPRILALLAAVLFASLTRGNLFNGGMLLYTAYAYDADPAMLGFISTGATAVGIPITMAAGHLMDRYGRRMVLAPGMTALAIALVFTAVTAALLLPLPVFIVAFVAVQAAQSFTGGGMQTVGSDSAPPFARGQFMGIWGLMGEIGSVVSPLMFGGLAEAAGYPAAFTVLGLPGLVTATLLWTNLREWRHPGSGARSAGPTASERTLARS